MPETNQSKPRSRLSASQSNEAPGPGKGKRDLVYPIGQIGYDFGTEAIRDSFRLIGIKEPDKPMQMLGYLRQIHEPLIEGLRQLFNRPEEAAFRASVDPDPEWPMSPILKPAEEMEVASYDPSFGAVEVSEEIPEEKKKEIETLKKLFHHIASRRHLLSVLMYNTPAAGRLIWTLRHGGTRTTPFMAREEEKTAGARPIEGAPVYAIRPQGPFARETYDLLIQYLLDQVYFGVERFSIPGHIVGEVTLLNKQVVPVIEPEIQGMFSWKPLECKRSSDRSWKQVFDRLADEVRNPGRTPKDRALNFGATTAFTFAAIFDIVDKKKQLFSIKADRNQTCRPGSDCWTIVLSFFDPDLLNKPHQLFEFTVDVSDVIPVLIGKFKTWRAGSPDSAD